MTDTRDLLLRGVLESPADDAARLVLADYLDEHVCTPAALARAELIRVGVELAGTPRHKGEWKSPLYGVGGPVVNLDHARLTARIEAILKRWGRRLLPKEIRRKDDLNLRVKGCLVCDVYGGYVEFDRGFVGRAGVELPWRANDLAPAAERFGRHLRTLLAANPVTSFRVSVEGCTPEVEFTIDALPDVPEYPWVLLAKEEGEGQPRTARVWQTRRDMLRDLPAVVSQVIRDTEFVRAVDGDMLAGLDAAEPDDGYYADNVTEIDVTITEYFDLGDPPH